MKFTVYIRAGDWCVENMDNDGADNVFVSPEFIGGFMSRVWECLAAPEPENARFMSMCQRHLKDLLSPKSPADYPMYVTEHVWEADTTFRFSFHPATTAAPFPSAINRWKGQFMDVNSATPSECNSLREDAKKLFPRTDKTYYIIFTIANQQAKLSVTREDIQSSDGGDIPAAGGVAPPGGGGGGGSGADAPFIDLCM